MNLSGKPDICVAIDFGTTHTGVAWMIPRERNSPVQVISDWPGGGDNNERKVPSVISGKKQESTTRWGFLCDELDESEKWRFFKIFLDPGQFQLSKQEGLSWAPGTMSQVHQLVTEFLRQVYLHISYTIPLQFGRSPGEGWDDMAVEFIFSVPTTWERPNIARSFFKIIRNAGFGTAERHEAVLGLTEAEAAAVSTMAHVGSAIPLSNGEVFLSIDAGGGTTDLAFVQITSINPPMMEQIQQVRGTGIGSMMVDKSFRQIVFDRLRRHPDAQKHLPADCAIKLSQSPYFRLAKHKFGQAIYDQDLYRIQMVGVHYAFSHEGIGVENGHMVFSRQELEGLFDAQLQKIIKCIKEAVDLFEAEGYKSVVGSLTQHTVFLEPKTDKTPKKYVILSGGLGSSAYIFGKLREFFKDESATRPCVDGIRVQMCADPQLVVVKGLLLERKNSILRTRVARASYGVVIEQPYSTRNHYSQLIRLDPLNQKKYVTDQIEWLVKKGDKIATDKVFSVTIERRVALEDPRQWTEHIVWSENGENWLPRNMTEPGVSPIMDLFIRIDGGTPSSLMLKKKRRKMLFWQVSKQYYICKYDIRLFVGSSGDLRLSVFSSGIRVPGSIAPLMAQWDLDAEQELSPIADRINPLELTAFSPSSFAASRVSLHPISPSLSSSIPASPALASPALGPAAPPSHSSPSASVA